MLSVSRDCEFEIVILTLSDVEALDAVAFVDNSY